MAVFWSHSPTIDVWDVLDRRRVRQVTPAVDHAHWSPGWYKVWVNPAGTRMASSVGWGTRAAGDTVARELAGLVVWDGQTGEAVALAQGQSVFYAAFLPGRDVFLMASNDLREEKRQASPEVVAFDYARNAYTAVFRGGHQAPITALDVTDDGRWLATGDKDGKVQLWDLRRLR